MNATLKKIEVGRNTYRVKELEIEANSGLRLINELLDHYKTMEVDLSDNELNRLIKSSFSLNTIEQLANERFENAPRKQKRDLIESFTEDVLLYTNIFSFFNSTAASVIEVKDGKALLNKKELQKWIDQNIYSISEDKSIELYNRHKELVKALNDLKDDIKENTGSNINTSQLIFFDYAGNATVNTVFYGK